MVFPLLIPRFVEPRLFYQSLIQVNSLLRLPLPKLVGDSPFGQSQQPAAKAPDIRVVSKFRDLANDRNDSFLYGLLRFESIQTGFPGDRVNQAPVRFEKFLPGPVILQVAETLNQAASSSEQSFLHKRCAVILAETSGQRRDD